MVAKVVAVWRAWRAERQRRRAGIGAVLSATCPVAAIEPRTTSSGGWLL